MSKKKPKEMVAFYADTEQFAKDDAPKVYCPKEEREVPVWHCLGSFIKQKKGCPELIEATVRVVENRAEVECKAQELGT